MENIPFKVKCVILVIPYLIVWAIIFSISLLIVSNHWWINLLVTFVITLFTGYVVTTFEGEEYDPDRMP